MEAPQREFDLVAAAADYVRQRLHHSPTIGIVLGTGLGKSLQSYQTGDSIRYRDIPQLQSTAVTSHAGELYTAVIADAPVVVFSGRIHYYEGHSLAAVVRPIRLMHALGCTHLIITNASGGLNPNYQSGDVVLIRDHINFPQLSPLRGEHDERWGPRFPDMSNAYSLEWIDYVIQHAIDQHIHLQQGVYALTTGPHLETPAEHSALHRLGADIVGMSTVPEVIVARQLQIEVLGISVVANTCHPADDPVAVTEQEIIQAVDAQRGTLEKIITLSVRYCRKEYVGTL